MNADPHRAALDHVLALVAAAPCGEELVLRGSMTMPAWVGDRARPPGDIDWVVRPVDAVPRDELHPYPYVDDLDAVRVEPEFVHGVERAEPWMFDDCDTNGFSPRTPPEGLRWLDDDSDVDRPHEDVVDLLRENPRVGEHVRLDADAASCDETWGYAYGGTDGGGVRVTVPYRSGDGDGSVRLDFAYDERLPEPPILLAVPRADGGPPTVVWSASPALSLTWKVRWLATDVVTDGRAGGKDLYDAVLLTEYDALRWTPRLLRAVRAAVPAPDVVRTWPVDWPAGDPRAWPAEWRTGDTQAWLDRLADGLGRLTALPGAPARLR